MFFSLESLCPADVAENEAESQASIGFGAIARAPRDGVLVPVYVAFAPRLALARADCNDFKIAGVVSRSDTKIAAWGIGQRSSNQDSMCNFVLDVKGTGR